MRSVSSLMGPTDGVLGREGVKCCTEQTTYGRRRSYGLGYDLC